MQFIQHYATLRCVQVIYFARVRNIDSAVAGTRNISGFHLMASRATSEVWVYIYVWLHNMYQPLFWFKNNTLHSLLFPLETTTAPVVSAKWIFIYCRLDTRVHTWLVYFSVTLMLVFVYSTCPQWRSTELALEFAYVLHGSRQQRFEVPTFSSDEIPSLFGSMGGGLWCSGRKVQAMVEYTSWQLIWASGQSVLVSLRLGKKVLGCTEEKKPGKKWL